MTRLTLTVVPLVGAEYLAFRTTAGWELPSGEFGDGESPAAAARRVTREWTGVAEPKLELVDFRATAGELRFVFRALIPDASATRETGKFPRMGLPDLAGPLAAKEVEEMQKTSLAYKLTRA